MRVQVLLSNLTEFSFVTAKKRTFGWMSKENAASEGQKYSFLKTRLELQRHNEGFLRDHHDDTLEQCPLIKL